MVIRPQPKQEEFLSSSADIAIYGGSAGGGKTFALLLEATRHVANPDFGAVFFRRTFPQITREGGLWDTATDLYTKMGAVPRDGDMLFRWPSGCKITFSHLQLERNKLDWQGAQIPLICWDELTHFTWTQFTYLLSRNRSTCGIRPYIRGSCNPDPDHWLRTFLRWWIDDDTGLAIPERSGQIRWMAIINNETFWADTKEQLIEEYGEDVEPLSVTFIPASLDDNQAMVEADPGYRAKLKALPRHERAALLDGDWNARPVRGDYFQRHWFEIVDAAPVGTRWIRYWDRAATEPSAQNNDPDWTVGALVGITPDKRPIIGDIVRFRGRPKKVRQAIYRTALSDGDEVSIGLEGEPGSSGVADVDDLVTMLAGFDVRVRKARTNKEVSWRPLSAQAEAGNVMVIRADWNGSLFKELESVPDPSGHDDQADAVSGGYNELTAKKKKPMFG